MVVRIMPAPADSVRVLEELGDSMKNSYYALVAVALGAVQVAGCIGRGSGVGSLTFSPDGKHVCYIREDRIEEMVVDGKIWWRSIILHWCSTSDPATESSTQIDTLGAKYRGYINVGTEVKWSPNSTRIGVLTQHKLVVVETNSGKKRELRDGTIKSFAWLSDGEVAYCTRRFKRNMQTRVICRENLDTQQKTEVFAFPERRADRSIYWEDWSPSGRFLILMEPDVGGQYHCVDVSNGTTRSFGQTDAYDVGVAWAPDSSRVFCVSNKVGPGYSYEALLLDPATGTTVDCTDGFQDTFAGHAPSLVPLWTADGKYVLVNALHIAGHLVQPDPWEAVPLRRMLATSFTAPTKSSKINPWLFRLPVAGWVGVLPTGNEGDSPVKYAADYSGQRALPLLEAYPRAISPDGTMAATIGEDGHVKIDRLGKWWLVPNEAPPFGPSTR
ncbi:MAG: TolB family protein [Planctomycetota bacterium]